MTVEQLEKQAEKYAADTTPAMLEQLQPHLRHVPMFLRPQATQLAQNVYVSIARRCYMAGAWSVLKGQQA